MLESTLVLWAASSAGPPRPGPDGRDHHTGGFSVFLAGGGIRGGVAHGATDEFGMEAVEDIHDFHDLHATMLHLCGVDHTRLTYRSGGRDYRLTDVKGRVIREIIL